jgi:hypothetical protein
MGWYQLGRLVAAAGRPEEAQELMRRAEALGAR